MKRSDLPDAIKLSKYLDEARGRLSTVEKWVFPENDSCYIKIENSAVMVTGENPGEAIKKVLIRLIESEVSSVEKRLSALGCYVTL